MAVRSAVAFEVDDAEAKSSALLIEDPRWLLVRRIAKSASFEKASQLRNILLYITRAAILHPERVLREYDIACDVLERRKDFNPAYDNIVRSQFSNLRRKLEIYFADEGKREPLLVRIPKGSYTPVFLEAPPEPQAPPGSAPEASPALDAGDPGDLSPASETPPRLPWTGRERKIAAFCLSPSLLLALIVVALASLLSRSSSPTPRDSEIAKDNAFVKFLGRWEGEVTVVVPDTSLVGLELDLKIDNVPLSSYTSGRYPEQQLSAVSDPKLRESLGNVTRLRNTTFNEAMVASDFVETMRRIGLPAKPRYSRDLRVSDLNEGNAVLIGGPGSDPWVSLFADELNFRWIEEPAARRRYFLNARPAPGEQRTYTSIYSWQGSDAVGYVDVALTQNPTHSGNVLLILGSDQQEAESAANLLLRGTLPPEITALLGRKDLRYFELFFRGKHIAGQADNSLELIAYRPL
jgi:hypothetical protein